MRLTAAARPSQPGQTHYFDAFSLCEPVPTSLENATGGERKLRELVRTNDIVLVSAVGALLDGANIHHLVLDQNMSVIEGSLGMLPRRILVHEDDNREARQILTDAGLAHELRTDD
jgi:hypothetical protein